MYNKKKYYLIIPLIVTLCSFLPGFFEENYCIIHNNKNGFHYFQEKNSDNFFLTKNINNLITFQNYNTNLSLIISEMYIDILSNGRDATTIMHFIYFNSGTQTNYFIVHQIELLTLLIDSRISSIVVSDALGELNYEWDILNELNIVNISLRFPIAPLEFTSFSISFLFENAIVSNPGVLINYILQWTLTFADSIDKFSLIVTLPNKFELTNQSAIDPRPDYKSLDGRRLEWIYYNIVALDDLTWIMRFKTFEQEDQYLITFKPIYWVAIVFTFVLGIIIGILVMFYYLKLRTDTERQEIVETLLSQPEKEIIKIIKRQDGVTTQSKIVDITGFSKAKVSYYITELENKGIISRERWGRMNRIRIIDDSVDKAYSIEITKKEDQMKKSD